VGRQSVAGEPESVKRRSADSPVISVRSGSGSTARRVVAGAR